MRRKFYGSEKKDLLYQAYSSACKKFKFWISVFYVLLAANFTLLISNPLVWQYISSYKDLAKRSEFGRLMNNYLFIPRNSLNKDIFLFCLYSSSDIPRETSWDNLPTNLIDGLNTKRKCIDTLNLIIGGQYEKEINIYYDSINSFIKKVSIGYDSLVEKIDRTSPEAPSYGLGIKSRFIDECYEGSRDLSKIFPIKDFTDRIFDEYKIPSYLRNDTLSILLRDVKVDQDSVDNFFEKYEINISYVGLTIKSKVYIGFSLIALFFLSFYLPLIYLNYKTLDKMINKMSTPFLGLPTFKNILMNLSIKPYSIIVIASSFFINILLPFILWIILAYNFRQVYNDTIETLYWYLFIIGVVVIIGFSLFVWRNVKSHLK